MSNLTRSMMLGKSSVNDAYTYAQLSALAAAGGLTPNSWYVAADSGVRYWASDASTLTVDQPQIGDLPLRKDSSARPTYTLHGDGTASTAEYAPTGVSVSRSTTPILYRTTQGLVGYIYGHQGAVGFGGKIISVDLSGVFYKYTAAAGVAATGATLAGTISLLFVDSRGYVFYGTSTGAHIGLLKRSTDDAATFATCLTMPGSTDLVAPMCEDEQGTLYIGAYGSASAGATGYNNGLSSNSRKVWKSVDGGDNWTEISTNFPAAGGGYTGPAGVHRHIHGVWWDTYRRLLYVSVGDDGATSKVYVSGDRGASFSIWTASRQCTAMAFTPTHVLYAADEAADRRIYRAEASSTLAAVVASTPAVCWDWILNGGLTDNSSTYTGFAWQGGTDDDGNVWFSYGKEGARTSLMASSDSGATWGEVASWSSAGRALFDFVQLSPYHAIQDGQFRYGSDALDAQFLSKWRLFAPGFRDVDPADLMLGSALRQPGVVQSLTGDVSGAVLIDGNNVHVHRGAYTLGGAVTALPLVSDSFDSGTVTTAHTLSISGTGVNPAFDSTHVVSAANAIKFDLGAGSGASTSWVRRTTVPWGRTLVAGDECWFSARYWVTAITAARLDLLEFGNIRVTLQIRDAIKRLEVFDYGAGAVYGYQATNEATAFPEGAFVRIKVAIVLAPTADPLPGRVRVWQDAGSGYRLVIDMRLRRTYNAAVPTNLFFGLGTAASGNFTTAWVDDSKYGLNADPDRPPAVLMTGTGQCLLPDGIYT